MNFLEKIEIKHIIYSKAFEDYIICYKGRSNFFEYSRCFSGIDDDCLHSRKLAFKWIRDKRHMWRMSYRVYIYLPDTNSIFMPKFLE